MPITPGRYCQGESVWRFGRECRTKRVGSQRRAFNPSIWPVPPALVQTLVIILAPIILSPMILSNSSVLPIPSLHPCPSEPHGWPQGELLVQACRGKRELQDYGGQDGRMDVVLPHPDFFSHRLSLRGRYLHRGRLEGNTRQTRGSYGQRGR